VLALGDEQYETGSLAAFLSSYESSWGAFRRITRPAVGNHEYGTPGAAGYFRYFGALAGDPTRGWYSYDVGTWHIVVLNSECGDVVGGCRRGSPQERWLARDLAAHPARCTMAYWHQPRFSSGEHGDTPDVAAFWEDLYAAGADVVLAGHDHNYERFAPQRPDGAPDAARGIREFVVGTGGKSERGLSRVRSPNSVVATTGVHGVLALTLHEGRYDWRFLPVKGDTFTDHGSASCH
jgi:hypothetical protein